MVIPSLRHKPELATSQLIEGQGFESLRARRATRAVTSGNAVTALVFSGMWAAEPGNWVALGLIAGSAAGNLADRLVRAAGVGHREVVDFLNLDWWPTFNRADSAPVRGVAGVRGERNAVTLQARGLLEYPAVG